MLYDLKKAKARRRGRELLELVGLSHVAGRPYDEYSMGIKASVS